MSDDLDRMAVFLAVAEAKPKHPRTLVDYVRRARRGQRPRRSALARVAAR